MTFTKQDHESASSSGFLYRVAAVLLHAHPAPRVRRCKPMLAPDLELSECNSGLFICIQGQSSPCL